MAKTLAHFSIARSGEDYLLTIEDAGGDVTEFTADYDQLDVITEAIEEALDADEEELEAEGDDEEGTDGEDKD